MGNEYGHRQPLFPKEIVLVIIAAVVIAGAVMIFGPHILSAINSGTNTVANPNPVNPIEIPKAGDTGQLPAVVNSTTIYINGGGKLKVEKVVDPSNFDRGKMESGTIYYFESKLDKEGKMEQADFFLVADVDSASAALKNVDIEFGGTTIKNFTVTNTAIHNGKEAVLITVITEILTNENFQKFSSSLRIAEKTPTAPSGGIGSSRQITKDNLNGTLNGTQKVMVGSLEMDSQARMKVLILHIAVIAKAK